MENHKRQAPLLPRAEITAALGRLRESLAYFDPTLAELSLTTLYEYAAACLLKTAAADPPATTRDVRGYLADFHRWWDQR